MDTTSIPLRHHHLAAMADAPCFALAALRGDEEDANRSEEKGTSVHALTLNSQAVVVAPMPRNDKHEAYRRFAEENDGCRIVTRSEYEEASRLADAVRRHREARNLIEGGEVEVTRHFDLHGRTCRATPDIVRPRCIADLKTSKSADPRVFPYHVAKYYYHSAMAWYQAAVPFATEVFLIVVETRPPYPVTVFRVSERALQTGRELHMGWFRALRECERTGAWPDYAEGGVVALDLPEPRRMLEQVA